MMRKRNCLLIAILWAMALCIPAPVEAAVTAASDTPATLVVYYSYTGNCRSIAGILADFTGADLLEILPAEEGVRYEANNYAIGSQMISAIRQHPDDAASYPGIKPVDKDLSPYENILIVTPLWWSNMAAIMQSYLFSYGDQMAGKNVGLVVSSHSSGISSVVADAKRLLPDVVWAGDALWINNSNFSRRSTLVQDWAGTLALREKKQTAAMYITIGGQTVSATLVDNSSTEALVNALRQGPITYEAHDYGGFEKVGPLGRSFPQNNEPVTTEPGDLILYQGNNLCIYYDTNSWNFTRLGKIDRITQAELKRFVRAGEGNVSVTLSLTRPDEEEGHRLAGDANMDGDVNVTDVMTVVRSVLGHTPAIFSVVNADCNGDKEVNVTDVMSIVNIILGRSAQ